MVDKRVEWPVLMAEFKTWPGSSNANCRNFVLEEGRVCDSQNFSVSARLGLRELCRW